MAVRNGIDERFPWEVGRAAPADRALGLELELIELVRRHDDIFDSADPEAHALARQIATVQHELQNLVADMPVAV